MRSQHHDDSYRLPSKYPASYVEPPCYPRPGEVVEVKATKAIAPQYHNTRATTINVAGFGRVKLTLCDGTVHTLPVVTLRRIDTGPRPGDLLHNGVWVVPPDKRPAGWERMGGRER